MCCVAPWSSPALRLQSTLLKVLGGLVPAAGGAVAMDEPSGFVFQNPDHQVVMPTVGADVAFGLGRWALTAHRHTASTAYGHTASTAYGVYSECVGCHILFSRQQQLPVAAMCLAVPTPDFAMCRQDPRGCVYRMCDTGFALPLPVSQGDVCVPGMVATDCCAVPVLCAQVRFAGGAGAAGGQVCAGPGQPGGHPAAPHTHALRGAAPARGNCR